MPVNLAIQFSMLALTGALFGAAFVLGLRHMRRGAVTEGAMRMPHETTMGNAARVVIIAATLMGAALLAWRTVGSAGAVNTRTVAFVLTNPFDAFLILGLLLALMVIYFRRTRHLRSLSFFLLPMIVVLLALGMLLAAIHSGGMEVGHGEQDVWVGVHVISIVMATVCFALGCVAEVVYLLADGQLRAKAGGAAESARGGGNGGRWLGFPPLATMEKFNQVMIYCGFPLLTIATFAGIMRVLQPGGFVGPAERVKLGCGLFSWGVYAVLLHVPPRFRGRRAAWLSIIGFAVFIGGYVASRWS